MLIIRERQFFIDYCLAHERQHLRPILLSIVERVADDSTAPLAIWQVRQQLLRDAVMLCDDVRNRLLPEVGVADVLLVSGKDHPDFLSQFQQIDEVARHSFSILDRVFWRKSW